MYAGASARGPRNRVDAFLVALEAELELRADAADADFGPPGAAGRPPLTSIYFGGGTPSIVPAARIARLIDRIRRRFGVADDAEVTVEANPGPDERGDAAALREAGVRRMSFGAQSLDPTELKRLGRRHRPAHVGEAVGEARRAGIDSINLDLLYDIPDTSLATWIDTLEFALALQPDHLSLYGLTLDDPDAEGLTGRDGDHLPTKAGARRWRAVAASGRTRIGRPRSTTTPSIAWPRTAGGGTRSRTGRDPATRAGTIWRTGSGARTRRSGPGRTRSTARHGAGTPPASTATSRPLRRPMGIAGPAARRLRANRRGTAAAEAAVLGLRTDRGLPLAAADGPPLADWFGWALAAELLDVTADDRIVLTTRGRLLSNELFARLI